MHTQIYDDAFAVILNDDSATGIIVHTDPDACIQLVCVHMVMNDLNPFTSPCTQYAANIFEMQSK